MSDTSIGAALGSGQGHGTITLHASLRQPHMPAHTDRGCPPPAGWWLAIVVMGGTAGWVHIIAALVT